MRYYYCHNVKENTHFVGETFQVSFRSTYIIENKECFCERTSYVSCIQPDDLYSVIVAFQLSRGDGVVDRTSDSQ